MIENAAVLFNCVFFKCYKDVDLLYELIEEKDAELGSLRRELRQTMECFEELNSNLKHAQMIIEEQQEQLAIYRQEVATSKTNVEALKVSEALTSTMRCPSSMPALHGGKGHPPTPRVERFGVTKRSGCLLPDVLEV